MNKKTIIALSCLFLPLLCFSQRGKKQEGFNISVTTSINFYPTITPYKFISKYSGTTNDRVILDFITRNSGTFTIEDGETILITRTQTSEFPTQLLGLGASVRLINESLLFHEFSLTKLSFYKSSHLTELVFMNSMDDMSRYYIGYDENTTAFAFRYELGKFFGRKKNKLKFGISGGIEPSFYFYKRTSLSQDRYPIKANITTIDLSIIPMLSAKLSKKVSMDFKVISNILLADFGSITENFPEASIEEQNGIREYNLPEITMAFSLILRYDLSDPKKRRR